MFNMSFAEMIILGVIGLIFIGPKQLPEVARTVGRLLNELKRTSEDLTGSFTKTRDSFDKQARNIEKSVTDAVLNSDSKKIAEKKSNDPKSESDS